MWAGSFAVRTGDVAVGVRVDDATLLAALRDVFASQLVDVADPPPYLSVKVNRDDGVPLLYEGTCRALRARNVGRLAHGLFALVADLGGQPPPAGRVRLRACAVVGEGGAVLLPSAYRHALDDARSSLARAGMTPIDGSGCDVDPAAGELVLGSAASLDHLDACLGAHGLLSAGTATNGDRALELPAPRGRVALRAALLDGDLPSSMAVRTARVAELITDSSEWTRLAAAARLAERLVDLDHPPARDPASLVQACEAATSNGLRRPA